jgi:hypothetical protein
MTIRSTLTIAVVIGVLGAARSGVAAPDEGAPAKAPLCPMVASHQKAGVYQLIEIIDGQGNRGVAEPGEKVTIKCTIVNLTKRTFLVAKNFVTPQHASIEARTEDPDSFPEATRPLIEALDGMLLSGGLDVPQAWSDWGHVRDWVHVAASHDIACACCIRHRQYSRSLEVRLPDENWSEVAIDFSQWIPAIMLSPEEHVKFDSDLSLTVKRRNSEQDGADQPATSPEPKPEGKEKPKPDPDVRPQ